MIPQRGVEPREQLSWVSAILSREFADRLDDAIIERVAAEEVAAFDDARVRDFVPILAMRRGRLRLREWTHRRAGSMQPAEDRESDHLGEDS